MVDGLCVGKLEYRMRLVDLLEIGLQETACNTAAEHRRSLISRVVRAGGGEKERRGERGEEKGGKKIQIFGAFEGVFYFIVDC